MTKYIPYIVIRSIFKFLNGKDLFTVSQVCRQWKDAAFDEKKNRGPISYRYSQNNKKNLCDFECKKIKIIKLSPIKSFLSIFLCNKIGDCNIDLNCHCEYLNPNFYSISLSNYCLKSINSFIDCMLFPDLPWINYITYTFTQQPGSNYLYCPELDHSYHSILPYLGDEKLLPFFIFDSPSTSIIIHFSELKHYNKARTFLDSFISWFPRTKTSVWGGIIDSITLCSYKSNMCQANVKFLFMFISSVNMQTWIVILGNNCDTQEKIKEKLQNFKNNIQLKKHSIGFMFTPICRRERFFDLETEVFNTIFSNMPLFHIFGYAAFGSKNLEELSRTNSISSFIKTDTRPDQLCDRKQTTLMIITYQ